MIKRVISAVMTVAIAVSIAGCQKKRVIPDDTLANIFHDAFVVNAYIGEERINLDSLQIYEPIFEQYGYTAKDVIYTVGNFSRRKSARLGTVVEQAISRLERENKHYAQKVVILDTIQNVAVRTFTRTVYRDSLIMVDKRADSMLLRLEISPICQGEYSISYNYKCEGDMSKYPRRAEFYFKDDDGFRNGYTSVSLNQMGSVKRTIIARKSEGKLVLHLGEIEKSNSDKSARDKRSKSKSKQKQKGLKNKPSITIRNLEVVYKPKTESAIDSLFARYVDVKIFADEFLAKKDSLTLSADSTRVSTPTAHND